MLLRNIVGYFASPSSLTLCILLIIVVLASPKVSSSLLIGETSIDERYLELFQNGTCADDRIKIAKLKRFIYDYPDYNHAYRSLIETYSVIDKLEEGKRFFNELLHADPKNPYAYYCLGRLYFQEGRMDSSEINMMRCVELDPHYPYAYGPDDGLVDIYEAKGDLHGAEDFISARLEGDEKNPCLYYGLARVYSSRYDWERALDMLDIALSIDSTFTLAYHSLINLYGKMGKTKEVLRYGRKLYDVACLHNDWEMASYALIKIGGCFDAYGDYQKSFDYYFQALDITRKVCLKNEEAGVLNNIAVTYVMLGLHAKALEYFHAALDIQQDVFVKSSIRTLQNIAIVYMLSGHKVSGDSTISESMKYYSKALELSRELGLKEEECVIMLNIGNLFFTQKDYSNAVSYYKSAMNIARSLKSEYRESYILRSLGSVHFEGGQIDSAIRLFERALEIGSENRNSQIVWESSAELGQCYMKLERWEDAKDYFEKTIALYDSVRSNLSFTSLGTCFLDDKYQVFPGVIRACSHTGDYPKAYHYAEKYKAKGLMDMMAHDWLHTVELIPYPLRTELEEVQESIEAAQFRLSTELDRQSANRDNILSLEMEISDLEFKRRTLIEELKNNYGDYYNLLFYDPPPLDELRQKILGPNRVLLEYVQGPERLHIFVVTADTMHYVEMPITRADIDSIMHQMSVVFRREQFEREKESYFPEMLFNDFSVHAAAILYKMLIRPIEKWLPEDAELIIVPDDILYYLPFEMLVVDTTGMRDSHDYKEARYLLHEYNISYSPAMSILLDLIEDEKSPEKGLLALGNPSFNLIDYDTLINESILSKRRGFPNLPYAEEEVRAIESLIQSSRNEIWTGEKASEHLFKSQAGFYKVIHLATHFIVDDERPLFSKFVLAGGDGEDGLLHTYEVFGLNLNTDLVVLGGCNTGQGTLHKGEGLIGISRAFFYAGAKSLLLSLWGVDDKATSRIMENFYSALDEGMCKSQALRKAKIEYLAVAEKDLCDPFFWAPFILVGDGGSKVFLPKENHSRLIRYFVSAGLFLGLFGFFLRRMRIKRKRIER